MMKISDFQRYIDLYGADLSRWPRHEIRPAVDLMQHDPKAGEILSAAEKFDQLLRHYPPARVNMNALANRIIQQTKRTRAAEKPAAFNPAYLYVPGGGLLIAAILGFMIGFHTPTKESLLLDPVFYAQDQLLSNSEGTS